MLTLTRCSGSDPAFVRLTEALDRDLGARYGERMDFFGRYNHSADVACALVARLDGEPAGCGCFKPLTDGRVEIKRVFVLSVLRKKGVARAVLRELENWARELGYREAVLETGVLQPEALLLYEAAGYGRIPNYEPYIGVDESVCFRKAL